MKQIIAIGFWIIIVLSYTNTNENERNIIGIWTLDSVSTPKGNIVQQVGQNLTFLNEENFKFEWNGECLRGSVSGKYFLLENPNRGLNTLVLIDNIKNYGQDTIRNSRIYDIVSLDHNRLKLLRGTEYLKKGNKSIAFNELEIYKRIK